MIESSTIKYMALHGTGIYAAPLNPLAPPQLIGIYSIHGASDIYTYICTRKGMFLLKVLAHLLKAPETNPNQN